MEVSVLITFSIIVALWFFMVLFYKFGVSKLFIRYCYPKIKKGKQKRIVKGLVIFVGTTISILFSSWMLANLSGSIILHVLNTNTYDKNIEIKGFLEKGTITKDFQKNIRSMDNYKGNALKVKDTDGYDLKYYAYWFKNDATTESPSNIKKIVIVHHGIWGSRFQTWPFIYSLRQVDYLKESTLFISYDALGWHDGKKRGKGESTFGIKEARDLYTVIKHAEKIFQPEEIITYGYSLGGGTIYNMLRLYKNDIENDNKLNKFIIDSGYYNLKKELIFYSHKLLGFDVGKLIIDTANWLYGLDNEIKFSFDAYNAASTINIDLLLLHSITDKTVDHRFTCDIYKARKQNGKNRTKTWLTTVDQQVGHVRLNSNKNTKNAYKQNLNEFFQGNFEDKGINGCG